MTFEEKKNEQNAMQFKSLPLLYQPHHISHPAIKGMPFFVGADKALKGAGDIYLC